jgi:hypothetical protein
MEAICLFEKLENFPLLRTSEPKLFENYVRIYMKISNITVELYTLQKRGFQSPIVQWSSKFNGFAKILIEFL